MLGGDEQFSVDGSLRRWCQANLHETCAGSFPHLRCEVLGLYGEKVNSSGRSRGSLVRRGDIQHRELFAPLLACTDVRDVRSFLFQAHCAPFAVVTQSRSIHALQEGQGRPIALDERGESGIE